MKNRIISVARKEFIEIRRDTRTLIMVLALPTVMLILYSYGINLDIKSIKTAVYDTDNTKISRDLIGELKNSGYFKVRYVEQYDDLEKLLDKGKARVAIRIPVNFSRNIKSNKIATVQTIVDGSDANMATVSISYVNQIIQRYSANLSISSLSARGIQVKHRFPPISVENRIWYNPELKSVIFIVPGMIAMIIMMLGSILTSLSIVGEKERGTFEKLIVTPIHSYEIVIGKILPFACLAFADIILCLLVGKYWFKVPTKGSIILLLSLASMFLFSTIGLGLLISSIVKTQRVAMLLSMFTSMLPTFLLSGFAFPIENMPKVIQLITYLIPARYFLQILRGILLKGVGLEVLWINALCLVLYSAFMIFISAAKFKKRLED